MIGIFLPAHLFCQIHGKVPNISGYLFSPAAPISVVTDKTLVQKWYAGLRNGDVTGHLPRGIVDLIFICKGIMIRHNDVWHGADQFCLSREGTCAMSGSMKNCRQGRRTSVRAGPDAAKRQYVCGPEMGEVVIMRKRYADILIATDSDRSTIQIWVPPDMLSATIRIQSKDGSIVHAGNVNIPLVDICISSLPPGEYFVVLEDDMRLCEGDFVKI